MDPTPLPQPPLSAPPAARAGLVLGIDPGLERTGYAVLSPLPLPREARIVEAGVIRLVRQQPLAQRLVCLADSLKILLSTHHPILLCCEELYAHYKHPRTAILMGHARGVILGTASRAGVPVLAVAATRVKKTLTGNGHARKPQIQRAIAATLRLPTLPEPHDVADALAIALCGLRLQAAAAAPHQPEELAPARRHPALPPAEARP